MEPIATSHLTLPSVLPSAPSGRLAALKPGSFANPAPVLKEDTVSLSPQSRLLHSQGQSGTVIAASLGTHIASVGGYLNIPAAAAAPSAPAPVAAASQPENAETAPAKSAEAPEAHE